MHALRPAVFLDRDGVIIEDVDLLVHREQARILPHVSAALRLLRERGFALVVVTNQPVVARGLASEDDVRAVHDDLSERLATEGASIDAWHYCPHHPRATLEAYRMDCDCRKPAPGMLQRAAKELQIETEQSFMVGDRVTDIAAGVAAGCRTVLVMSGKHLEPPIQTARPIEVDRRADHECLSLLEAADWIVAQRRAA